MADLQSETKQNSSCTSVADSQTKVHLEEQMTIRGRSSSPSPVPPCKLPRNHSPSSSTQMSDAGEEEQMETNRGETQGKNLEGVVPTEGPTLSHSERRKSWRRATLSRRSLPALSNPSQGLCRSISLSLPQQERLEKLMEASMRLAIERTKNSLQSTPNATLESFQKQVDDMQKEWCRLAQNIRREPQCQQLSMSAASNPEMQRAVEQTQKAICRLQVESESWEALLNKHRSKAEELARKVEQGQASGVTLDPTCLAQSSQGELMQSKPDYRGLLRRQLPVLHTMEMVMDVQCKMVKELLSIQKQSQLFVKETSCRLAADAGFQDLSSDLIRNLMAVPVSSVTP